MGSRRAAAAVAALALLAGAVAGFARPTELIGAGGWSIAVMGVLFGLGGIVRRALRIDLGFGEQLLLGTVGWILATGILMAAGLASRGPLLGVAAIGLAMALAELARFASAPPRARSEDHLAIVACCVVLAGVLAINALSMVGSRANPYDDHVAYVALVKRLLDCGDLAEPFSFRRLSAYGGQTALQALAALRGDVAAIDLLDRGIFQAIGVLVVIDLIRRRRLHLGMAVAIVAFLVLLWDLALNSASIWTGFTCFVGAYSFAARDDLSPRTSLYLATAAAAAACTLRQNYLLPAGLFVLFLLIAHLRAHRTDWRGERRTIAIALGVAGIIVLPYAFATWRDCGSFLYPMLLGNGNPAAPLRPTGGTLYDELRFFVAVTFNAEPIRIWWVLAPLTLLVRDTRARKPWFAFLAACVLGFTFLVHSFMLSDAWNLWRYAFGYMTPLAIIFLIEVCAQLPLVPRAEPPPVRAGPAVTVLALVAMLVQLAHLRGERYEDLTSRMRAAASLGTTYLDPRAEATPALQAAIPAGAKVAMLVDDPWLLDFSRNRIVLLDLVGFVAPPPGIPSFTTPEHWRSYFLAQGIRYVAFTDGAFSQWLYRRQGWVWRMYTDDELFRFIAAHVIDALDMLDALAHNSRVLFHRDGLWAIDLGERAAPEADRGPPEIARMDRFIREVSERELHDRRWTLASRSDVVYRTDSLGPSNIMAPPGTGTELERLLGRVFDPVSVEPPHRWISDRSLVRVHGTGKHRLRISAWLDQLHLATHPALSVYLDGERIANARTDATGNIAIDVPATCVGWCDVYLVVSTISEWWSAAADVRAAEVLDFDWTPAP